MSDNGDIDEAVCAYAPGKQEWKERGNYYTQRELRQMEMAQDVFISHVPEPMFSAN